MRKCPHGVDPLDDYNVPEDEHVFSAYCAECYREQTGRYPEVLSDEGWVRDLSYEWPKDGETS